MQNKKLKKRLLSLCAVWAIACSVGAVGMLGLYIHDEITAYAADWWGETAYEAEVYAWNDGKVDGNGWTNRVCGTNAWTVGSKVNTGINQEGYTSFTTANQGDMFNNNELTLQDEKMLTFSYKKGNDGSDSNPDFSFFLVKEVPYKQNRPMRFDASLGGIPVIIKVKGTTVSVNGYDNAIWENVANNKYHTVNIYIGADGNSWVSLDGVKKTIKTNRFAYVKHADGTNEQSEELGEYAAWLNIHSQEDINVEVSKPEMTELVDYSITLNRSGVRLQQGEQVSLAAEANFDHEGYDWTTGDESVATVDDNGTVTAVGAGTTTITVSAADVKQTCTVEIFAYIDPNGWMTTETSSTWSYGILADSYEYDEIEGVTTFYANDCCDVFNKTAFDLTEGPISFTLNYGTAESWTMLGLLTKTQFTASDRYSNENYGPLAVEIKDEGVSGWSNKWDSSETIAAPYGKDVTFTVYIGSGEETDRSFIAVNGEVRYHTTAKLSDFAVTGENGETEYLAYFFLFSAKARLFNFGAFERGNIVALDKKTETLTVGDSLGLTASILPAASVDIQWTSSDAEVATVDGEGKVTAVKAGTAMITATLGNGFSSACVVTVNDIGITGVSLDKTTLSLTAGQKEKLTAAYTPENAIVDISMTWQSLNAEVATVDGEGNVTAIKAGTAVIVVTCGDCSATCTVTVTEETTIDSSSSSDSGTSDSGTDSETSGKESGGGCGSVIGGGMVAITAAAFCAILGVKRKHD